MHLETIFPCLQSIVLLIAEVFFVLSTSTASAMSPRTETFSVGDHRMTDDSNVKSKTSIAEEHNEIVEKLKRIVDQKTDNRILQPAVSSVEDDSNIESPNADGQETQRPIVASSATSSKTEKSSAAHKTNWHSVRATAPKYMLDLYHKFSTDKYSHPMANIVRSFTNINEDGSALVTTTRDTPAAGGNSSRVHRMLFNVTSIGRDEDIYLAELRLFTVVDADRRVYDGVGRRVAISEVVITPEGRETRSELIVSKEIQGKHSRWEAIPITDAVRKWIRQRSNPRGGDTHMIDVRTEIVGHVTGHPTSATPAPPLVDINVQPHNENEPLLLVFSNDRRRRRVHESSELVEMLGREVDPTAPRPDRTAADYEDYEDELEEDEYEEEAGVDARKRRKRSPYHDIRELHKSIVGSSSGRTMRRRMARETYEDGEAEEEYVKIMGGNYTADDDNFPRGVVPRRLHMMRMNGTIRSRDSENWEEAEREGHDRIGDGLRFDDEDYRRQNRRQRVRRSKRQRTMPCQRKPMYVHFVDIFWDNWVIAPQGYQAYECTGKCYWPLGDHMTPTKHSVIQTLLNSLSPGKASPTCCVPTKLDPITMLYIDDMGVATYKYKYDGMVVAECGCR